MKFDNELLPIHLVKNEIINEIKNNTSLVLVGETGSGKTQIPQFIYNYLKPKKKILITQPRRVAAITLSQRVAKEMNSEIGKLVGYSIRFEDVTNYKETKIKYATDGMIIREAQIDPLLKQYEYIILDESHERTINTDILFGIVKSIQKKRKDLKVIIMSATLQEDIFAKFFNAKIFHVKGRQFPVEIYYTDEPQNDYIDSTVITCLQTHLDEKEGDILVFLTGQEEIESIANILEEKSKLLPSEVDKLIICPIFSNLPSEKQMEVFEKTPIGCRKIVLATNIAETSITISGIKFVIDCGFVKLRDYNPMNGLESLKITQTAKANSWQRSGRAGREQSGKCFRLYTEDFYENEMIEYPIPEIQRCNLSEVVLQMKSIGIDDILEFDFIDKPSKKSLIKSFELLVSLNALELNTFKLTKFGKKLAEFPLPPMFSSVLLKSSEFKCTEEILTIISMLSVESIFFSPQNKREESDKSKMKFSSIYGDLISLLKVYDEYKKVKGDSNWCWNNFINSKSMKKVMLIRKQLKDLLIKLNVPIESSKGNNDDMLNIRKALASGFFLNSATRIGKKRVYKTLFHHLEVRIHPSSIIPDPLPKTIIFTSIVETSKLYIRDICSIETEWLAEISPNLFRNENIEISENKPKKNYTIQRNP
eukprot:gene4211-7548_t